MGSADKRLGARLLCGGNRSYGFRKLGPWVASIAFSTALCTDRLPCRRQDVRDHIGFDEVSGLDDIFVGAKIRKKKRCGKFLYNVVEGSVSGETILKVKCLSQVKDAWKNGMELSLSVAGIWVYFITEHKS